MLMLYGTLSFSIYMLINKYVSILKYEDTTYEEDAAVWVRSLYVHKSSTQYGKLAYKIIFL
jgi:hypothetical protein